MLTLHPEESTNNGLVTCLRVVTALTEVTFLKAAGWCGFLFESNGTEHAQQRQDNDHFEGKRIEDKQKANKAISISKKVKRNLFTLSEC